jgi:hypothetical protein
MGKLTIIKADGTVETKEVAKLKLDDLQEGVGGFIETVPYLDRYEDAKCVAFCDEEGKLKRKPINEKATAIWYDDIGQPVGDYLVGDVVIVQGADLLAHL